MMEDEIGRTSVDSLMSTSERRRLSAPDTYGVVRPVTPRCARFRAVSVVLANIVMESAVEQHDQAWGPQRDHDNATGLDVS